MSQRHRDAPEYEWQQFGTGYIRRASDGDDWEDVALEDVPAEVVAAMQDHRDRLDRISTHGYDPQDPPRPFVQITRASE